MTPDKLDFYATALINARKNAVPIKQYKNDVESFDEMEAYSIQEKGIEDRLSQGEVIIGQKMGLTSKAKREQMDLHHPLYGILTDKMKIENGGSFSLEGSIHPKIEPEVAFLINQDLKGKMSEKEVLASIGGIYPALEILDSRFNEFQYFSLEEVISDNSSSSHFILGDLLEDFSHLDINNLKMNFMVNGETAHEGNSIDISEGPVNSVIQLCELLARRDQFIQKGSIVLAGAATPAVHLKENMNVELFIEGLSTTKVSITK